MNESLIENLAALDAVIGLGSIRISEWHTVLDCRLSVDLRLLGILGLNVLVLNGLDIRLAGLWLLDDGLLDSGVGDDVHSLHGLVVNVLLNSLLRDVLDLSLVSVLGYVLGDVLNLLVVSVGSLHGLVIDILDSLVLSDGLGDGHHLGPLLGHVLGHLSLVRHLALGGHGLVVGVSLLNRDVLNVRSRLRLLLLLRLNVRLNGLNVRLNGLSVRVRLLRNVAGLGVRSRVTEDY